MRCLSWLLRLTKKGYLRLPIVEPLDYCVCEAMHVVAVHVVETGLLQVTAGDCSVHNNECIMEFGEGVDEGHCVGLVFVGDCGDVRKVEGAKRFLEKEYGVALDSVDGIR